jgi:hypothetical protein
MSEILGACFPEYKTNKEILIAVVIDPCFKVIIFVGRKKFD